MRVGVEAWGLVGPRSTLHSLGDDRVFQDNLDRAVVPDVHNVAPHGVPAVQLDEDLVTWLLPGYLVACRALARPHPRVRAETMPGPAFHRSGPEV